MPRQPPSLLSLAALVLALFGLAPKPAAFTSMDAPPSAGEPGGPGLALRASKVLTAAREGPPAMDSALLLMREGKIEALGRADEIEVPDDYVQVDLGSAWIAPGLIDLHNHIGSGNSLFINDINDTVYLTNPGLRASAGVVAGNRLLQRAVAGGVTSALYIPGSGSNMGGAGVLIRLGMPTYEEALLRDPGSLKLAQAGNPERWTIRPGRSFMNWNTRNTFRRGLAYARRWQSYEQEGGARPEVDLQFEIFRDLLTRRTQVSTHTQIYQVVLMTITMVRMEFGLDVYIDHGSFDGYRTGELVAKTGVPAILGPRTIATTTRGGDTDGRIQGMAAGYQERGVEQIGFNTDCIDEGRFITPPQEELSLQAALAVRYGFDDSNAQALKGLTLYPAEAAGLDDRLGTLEAGKDADLVVMTGNPIDPRHWVRRVYSAGRLVYDAQRDGRRW